MKYLVLALSLLVTCECLEINVTDASLKTNYDGTVGDGLPPNLYLYHVPKHQLVYIEPELRRDSWNATEKFPLSISAWTDNAAFSFTLPLMIEGSRFYLARRFLCPSEEEKATKLYVAVNSESPDKVDYRLQVRSVERGKFIIEKLDRKTTDFAIGPAWPDAFEFIFPDGIEVVDIVVEAVPDDKGVNQPASMFIQEPKCPMLSTLDESDKAYRTIEFTRGARTTLVKSESYPSVFLSFVATKNQTKWTEKKKIHLTVTRSGSDMSYSTPLGASIGISIFIFLIPAVYVILFKLSGRRGHDERPSRAVPIGGEPAEGVIAQPTDYDASDVGAHQGAFSRSQDRLAPDPEHEGQSSVYPPSAISAARYARLHWLDLAQTHRLVGAITAVSVLLLFAIMLSSKAEYEKTDLCYYNYECLRYQKSITAFNHVFASSFAYGAAAVAMVFYMVLLQCCFPGGQGNGESRNMRPLVVAAIMCFLAQAFLSGLFQSCPSRFLHFSENAFLILSVFLSVATFYYSLNLFGLIAIWIVIIIFAAASESPHLASSGRVIATVGTVLMVLFFGFVHIQSKKKTEEKSYRQLIYSPEVYLAVFWCVVQASTVAIFSTGVMDYSSFVTCSVIISGWFYIVYHMLQKRNTNATGHFLAIFSLVLLALAFWIIGLVFYLKKNVDVMATSALSRSHNTACVLWNFYDNGDVWAFCSAYALFYQFVALLFYKST